MEISTYIKKEKINAIHSDKDIYDKNYVQVRQNYKNQTVTEYIVEKTNCTEERMLSSFRLVNLEKDIVYKNMMDLSSSEKIKVELAIPLILNEEQIVLYYFDLYFMEKDLLFFKKLFCKLVKKYHKTIVLIQSKFSFTFDFADFFLFYSDEDHIETFEKNELFQIEFENSVLGVPPILMFIKYVNHSKKKIGNYTDIKELIKEIYREV